MTSQTKHKTYFRFYFNVMILLVAYKLGVTSLTLFVDPIATIMLMLQTLSGLAGAVGLVLSLLAIIFLLRDHYSKLFLLVPVSYIGFGLLGFIITIIIGQVYLSYQYQLLGSQATSADYAAISDQFASQPPVMIALVILLRTLIVLFITIIVGLKFKKLSSVGGAR